MRTKVCTKCKTEKNIEVFSKNKNSKDGLQHHCKVCIMVYTKSYKHIRKIKSKAYYEANKDRIYNRVKSRYESNKDKINAAREDRRNSKSANISLFNRLLPTDKPLLVEGVITVACKSCGKRMTPTESQVDSRARCIEGVRRGSGNFYCSDNCKEACIIYKFNSAGIDPRSKLYIPKTEQQKARACQTDNLKQLQCDELGHNYCEKCGDIIDVELHHTLEVAKHGKDAINSAGHILLCVGCHINMECTA